MIRIKTINYCLCFFLIFWLAGCDSDSDGQSEAVETVLCTLEIVGNYDAATAELETNLFNPDSTSSYHFSFTAFFADIFNNTHSIKLYFLKTDQALNLWDVYVFIDDIEAHVAGGSLGSEGQAKAQLMFDNQGALLRVLPSNVMINNLILSFSTYHHNFNILFPAENNTHLFDQSFINAAIPVCEIES